MSLAQKDSEEILYNRTRIYVNFIYRNETSSLYLSRYLPSIPGISTAKSNPVTGKVLVVFNEKLLNETLIKKYIYDYIKNFALSISTNPALKNKNNLKEEYALPISIDEPFFSEFNESGFNKTSFHSMDIKSLEIALDTDLSHGLTNSQVQKRIREIGFNVLSDNSKKSFLSIFLQAFNTFSTRLLIGAGGLSFLLGQIPDGFAILGIVIIEAALGTMQRYKAEESLYSLKDMLVDTTKVLRGGRECLIDAGNLVPGDIILVEAGDKVPADSRVIECNDLKTMEASLTGESTSVVKSFHTCSPCTELGNRHNMLFMGTSIISGKGRALVVATGMNTEIGRIALMLQNIVSTPTPLENKLKAFTNSITKLAFVLCIGISSIGFLSGRSAVEVMSTGIGFALGAIPESLPAVITAAMALSVQKITKRNAIVRKLPAVEALGCANVVCCDKTGTLTMNEMTVKMIYTDNNVYYITGSGYNPKGEFNLKEGDPSRASGLIELLKAGILCNNSCLIPSSSRWDIQGDPTEAALIVAGEKYGLDTDYIRKSFMRIREIPFDSARRCMTVITQNNGNLYSYIKGAPDSIMEKCKTIYEDGIERLFTLNDRERFQNIYREMGSKALRVLGLAYKEASKAEKDIDDNFVFLGLVGMEDPPRKGVKTSIQKCKMAGIRILMITGDDKNTASAIGQELGLLTDGLVISGSELDTMTDNELESKINRIQVFARTSPEQKYKIVKALKKMGNVVAMTGDGVNDAPAIKEADIGIAMGSCGSDVAKDAASITLVDDNFSTIVAAIEEGRTLSNNIRNTLRYLLSGSAGEIIAIFLSSIVSGIPPMLSLQLLWINVIGETIMGSSLVVEASTDKVMALPPEKKASSLMDNRLKMQIANRGLGIGLTTFGLFEGSMLLGLGLEKARTLAFTNLITSQLVNAYDCRNRKDYLSNGYMNAAALSSLGLLSGILYLPFLRSLFGTVPLGPLELGVVYLAARFSRL